MQVSRETKICNTVCTGLVLSAGVVRLLTKRLELFSYNSVIFALFTAAASIWLLSLQKRLLLKDIRRNLIAADILMIFWIALRTLKYDFLPDGHFTARYAWYMYYIPMLIIPLLMFLCVLSVGKPYDRPAKPAQYLLFIPAALILLGILTNDLHQKAFYFNNGLENWNVGKITRGFVYYAAIAYIAVLFAAMLAVVLVRCGVPERRKLVWAPLVPLVFGAAYIACVLADANNIFTRMFTAPEIGCFIFAAFMECLICVRLFPNNDNYGVFLNSSSIGAGIMDNGGAIRYKSEKSIQISKEQAQRAQTEAVLSEDGRLRLKSHAVRGGFCYWWRDITEIDRLNGELKNLGDITAQENSMLAAENKMRSERLQIAEQNRLYDDMAKGVKKQLDILNKILDAPPEDETEFEKTMKYACILNAYVKRRSNLVLLCHQSEYIQSGELRCAAEESLEYVRFCGINALCAFDGEGTLHGRTALLAYEIFEAILEAAIPGADNILAYFNISATDLIMRMEINAPKEPFSDDCIRESAKSLGGTLKTETDETAEYVTLTLPTGGETP